MKLEENKHDHKLTNWLKVGIFSILMLAPLLASVSQWMYATFNKNAYQSYSNELEEKSALLNASNINTYYVQNQVINTIYDENITFSSQSGIFGFSQITLDLNTLLNTTGVNYIGFRFYTSSNTLMRFYDSNSNEYTLNNANNTIGAFSYVVDLTTYTTKAIYNYRNANTTIYKVQKLDNAFYYGVDQMTKSDLFNWTQNTALYTGIKAMTDNLQIQTNAIAILITYWFILTIIYVIIDIVLKMFTFMTHVLSAKM